MTHHLLIALHQQLHTYNPFIYHPDNKEDGNFGNPTIIINHNQHVHYIDDFNLKNTLYLTSNHRGTKPITLHKHDPQLLTKIQQWLNTP